MYLSRGAIHIPGGLWPDSGGEARAKALLLATDCPTFQLPAARRVESPVLPASVDQLPLLLSVGKASYPVVFREGSKRRWGSNLPPEPLWLEWKQGERWETWRRQSQPPPVCPRPSWSPLSLSWDPGNTADGPFATMES